MSVYVIRKTENSEREEYGLVDIKDFNTVLMTFSVAELNKPVAELVEKYKKQQLEYEDATENEVSLMLQQNNILEQLNHNLKEDDEMFRKNSNAMVQNFAMLVMRGVYILDETFRNSEEQRVVPAIFLAQVQLLLTVIAEKEIAASQPVPETVVDEPMNEPTPDRAPEQLIMPDATVPEI